MDEDARALRRISETKKVGFEVTTSQHEYSRCNELHHCVSQILKSLVVVDV